MKNDGIIATILSILFWVLICWCCCCGTEANADTVGCTVICEVPETIEYRIPKIKGDKYFELTSEKIEYQIIERN